MTIVRDLDPTFTNRIRSKIENKSLQNLIILKYNTVDSTNTEARRLYYEHPDKLPMVILANGQTAGRGRRGRSFDSEPGAGVYISFLTAGGKDESLITVRAAVKCARAIERVYGISVSVKWVNDIIVSGRKLAGILAEGEYDEHGRQKYSIVGMGINISARSFPPELREIAASVEAVGGRICPREDFIAALIDEYFKEESDTDILREYRDRLCILGKTVEARRIGGGEFECTPIDVTDTGALLVRLPDGNVEELISAEISIKLSDIKE